MNGDDAAATREEILNAATSFVYAPNADNALATIKFRDGRQRQVRAADLVNGAIIANVAATAVEYACLREAVTGECGLKAEDVQRALVEEFETSAAGLSVTNCRNQLGDLPQDVDVVSVEVVRRPVPRPDRYLGPRSEPVTDRRAA